MKLNNIVKISTVPCQLISGFLRTSETEAKISEEVSFTEIEDFKRPASLTIADKVEDGNRLYQTKLTFYTCEEWQQEAERLAFLCETVDGVRYLIGSDERPYPVVTQQQNHPNSYADNQLTEVVVNYSSSKIPPILL